MSLFAVVQTVRLAVSMLLYSPKDIVWVICLYILLKVEHSIGILVVNSDPVVFGTFYLYFQFPAKPVLKETPPNPEIWLFFFPAHLCCSFAAGEAHFPPVWKHKDGVCWRVQVVVTLGTEEFFHVLSAHQGCCYLLGLGPGVGIHWLGVGFLWFLLLMLSYLQRLGRKNLDESTLPDHSTGWGNEVYLECFKIACSVLGFSWGLTKQRTSLTAAFIFRSAETSVLLLWGFLFPYYFSNIGFCNLCINIFIWLCNCIDP